MKGPRRKRRGEDQLSQWTLEHLVDVGIRQGLKGFRPLALHDAPLTLRPYLTIPTDLLHVIVELKAMAIVVQSEAAIVNTGVQLRRNGINEAHPLSFQKLDGLPQLLIASHLDAKRHTRGVFAEPQRPPQLLREEAYTVMFRATTQEHTPRPLVHTFLAVHKAQALSVERLGLVDVSDEQPHGADLGDLERPRQ